MNLYNYFIELEARPSSYYYDEVLHIKPISNIDKCWKFIEKYFKYGEKEAILDHKEIDDVKKNGKHEHTVSLYFLGISLMEKVENKILFKLEELGIHARNYDFKFQYTWFLTCLFHDYAWNIECKRPSESYVDEDNLYNSIFPLRYSVFDHDLTNGEKYQPCYNKSIVSRYFWFKYKQFGQLDHGIIAGQILFDRLLNNYYDMWERYCNCGQNRDMSFEYFVFREKVWRREHWDHFAYISDSIIAHNIWLNDGSRLYQDYGLLELEASYTNQVKYEENPLLYILGVLDTIEPVKFFNHFFTEYIWNNIDYEVRDDGLWMKVNSSSVFNYSEWFKKIKSLEEWIDTRVIIKGREILIKIPFDRV